MVKVREDMTGWIMSEHGFPNSRLTVLEQAEDHIDKNGNHHACWLCECCCEERNQIKVIGTNLRSGHTTSCGCITKESIRNLFKKYNNYDLSKEYGVGFTINTNREFYFDIEDYDKICGYCWCEGERGYPVARVNGKVVPMHKLIVDYNICDHINRNPFDNRKLNLRAAEHRENDRNKSILSSNTSGITGVSWDKSRQKWRAYIKIDDRWIQLGRFVDKDDAIRARLAAEAKYFMEFAPQKHLYSQYNIDTQQSD